MKLKRRNNAFSSITPDGNVIIITPEAVISSTLAPCKGKRRTPVHKGSSKKPITKNPKPT